jgi:hypothetical protein
MSKGEKVKIIPCFVDKKKPSIYRVKIRGTSKANPRTYRPLCAEHGAQAIAAGYKVQDINFEEVDA